MKFSFLARELISQTTAVDQLHERNYYFYYSKIKFQH